MRYFVFIVMFTIPLYGVFCIVCDVYIVYNLTTKIIIKEKDKRDKLLGRMTPC